MNRSRPTKRHGAIALACTGGLLTSVGLPVSVRSPRPHQVTGRHH